MRTSPGPPFGGGNAVDLTTPDRHSAIFGGSEGEGDVVSAH